MLGAAGALCCAAAGMALGSWMREKRMARFCMLQAMTEALGGMRLLLEQERPALPDLFMQGAQYAGRGQGAQQTADRLKRTAEHLMGNALLSVSEAYARACVEYPAPWERAEEKAALEMLFFQLGSGTAAMREQAAASCIRRLRPIVEAARQEAETGGRLCMQLGLLLGLMAGIALW